MFIITSVLKFAPKATALDSTSVTHNVVYNTNIAVNEQHGVVAALVTCDDAQLFLSFF